MYCVIIRKGIDPNPHKTVVLKTGHTCQLFNDHDKSKDQIIGVNDLGNISLKGAKVSATAKLKRFSYSSFINYGGGRGTIFPWYTCSSHPIWVLRGKKYRYFKHKDTGEAIHAYLIPKTYPDAKDELGLPELIEASTQEITFD